MSGIAGKEIEGLDLEPEALSPKGACSARVLRNAKELLDLRCLWEKWATEPTCDMDHFLLVCRTRENVRNPHVIVVSRDDEPVAILAARLENSHIAPSIGYFTPFKFAVRSLSTVYGGLLGRVDDAVATALMNSLNESLEAREADVVTLYQLPEESALLSAALKETSSRWRDREPILSTHWQLSLHDKPSGLLQEMTAKHRSWIRRKARDLEKSFAGRVSYYDFKSGGSVPELCAELESVARLTYQRGLGQGFRDDADHRERFDLFNREKALRAWTLRVDNVPRAFCVGFVYHNVFYFTETGYDPDFRTFEIGTLMFMNMTDSLIAQRVAKFDFGLGDAYYKKRFGDHSWQEATLRLYSRSAKGYLVCRCAGFVDSVSDFVRRLVRRFGVLDRLKRTWRRRLSGKMRGERDASG